MDSHSGQYNNIWSNVLLLFFLEKKIIVNFIQKNDLSKYYFKIKRHLFTTSPLKKTFQKT